MRWVAFLAVLYVGCAEPEVLPIGPACPFDYDASKPLNARVEQSLSMGGLRAYRFSFDGQKSRVPALLAIPNNASKPPVLLLLHGMGGDKEKLSPLAATAAAEGYACLMLDAPLHGERSVKGREIMDPSVETTRDNWIEAIVDWRRAIDYLQTRTDVDSDRIILLGFSMGGMMGALLAGVDTRIDAAALLLAGGNWAKLAELSKHPTVRLVPEDAALRRSKLTELQEILDPIDPKKWVAKISPRPVLFVNGIRDEVIPKACADELINVAGEPKTVIWDDVGHTVALESLPKIVNWIRDSTPKSVVQKEKGGR